MGADTETNLQLLWFLPVQDRHNLACPAVMKFEEKLQIDFRVRNAFDKK